MLQFNVSSKFIKETTEIEVNGKSITLENGIILRNCGAAFCPDGKKYQLNAENVRLDANVIFVEEENAKLSPGCQLCLRVPGSSTRAEPKDLYIGLELPFHHPQWSKAWIPALDLQPRNTFRSPLKEFIEHGRHDILKNGKKYKLSASIFGGYATSSTATIYPIIGP